MDGIASGRSNAQVADELVLAQKPVKNTTERIDVELAATTRGEAIAWWLGIDR